MLILILLAAIFLVSMIIAAWGYTWERVKTCVWFALIAFIAFVLFISLGYRSLETARNIDTDYQVAIDKKEALEYWIDFVEPSSPTNAEICRQIKEFNEELELHKKYLGDPWRGWFWNEKIAMLDYIKLPEAIK